PLQGRAMGVKQFKWLLQPTVGVEYDDITGASAGVATSSRGRVIGNLEADLYPWAGRFDKRLILSVKYGFRLDVYESRDLNDPRDRHYLRTASLTYYLSGEKVGVGLDRVDGENPSTGLADQEYTQFSLKVKR
ncbi:MAG TPA: hypothetical protein VFT43_00715, partial [Candidatus Polarisedimenticolia bacterium]|nr:hypothetical protein [Candidatus Polarisedimenticolia bacterium]